ncbi:MAG: aa3-type cytochrome oxidase subunit IV, partial [Pseudonocardiaceae bacterium]
MSSSARIFFLLGILALMAAIIFPIVSHEPPGSAMLAIFALSMLYIAWQLNRGAHSDPADDLDAEAEVGPAHVFPSSPWPPVMALAVLIVAIGIGFSPVIAAIGAAILVASAAGWFLQHVQMGSAAHQAAASDMYPVVEAPPSGAVTTGP